AEVMRGDLLVTVSVSGNLDAPDDRYLAFATPGTVQELLVEKGDAVSKGDVLACLNTEDLERNIDLARTSLRQAQVQYEIAENQLRETIWPHYYNGYVIDVPGTWIALRSALENLDEARGFMEQGDLMEAYASLDEVVDYIEQGQYRARSRPWDFPLSIRIMELHLEGAKAALDAAELNMEAAKDALEDTTIVAPFDGVVTAVSIHEGDHLSAVDYARPAIHLVNPTKIEMSGLIDEMDIADIGLGQEAIVTLDALPGLEVAGSVSYISEAAMIQAGVVMYETTIMLHNPGPEIKDGMSATADIILERRENVLLVPGGAITKDSEGKDVVMVWTNAEVIEERSVVIGLSHGRMTEILSGLKEGETVMIEVPE
ncbi:MAG: efflux RND transporter periplasmic adaptor subunit, partial [Chloroflexi bacterium]|nr:efflux RND transporter periplasmic adaptor subunit [Chloroflexota bacterium]